ncbi:MAG: PPC domain-containing protein, partial [Deltaproteobacteria bacterium]|nr:PPC domain-containing protein [Deltaproteobacteria bacterium]
ADADGDKDGELSCPVAVALGLDAATPGDTTNGNSDITLSCAGGPAPNSTYSIEIPGAGALDVTVEVGDVDEDGSADFDSVVGLRRTCDDPDTEETCNDEHWVGDVVIGSRVVYCAEAAETITAVVAGYGGFLGDDGGAFTITASHLACGDGSTCVDGLGCVLDLDGGDACEGAVPLSFDTTVSGTTAGLADDLTGACVEAGGADAVYAVTSPGVGAVSWDLDPVDDFDAAVLLRGACADAGSEIACDGSLSGVACVEAGDYSLIVDGDTGGFAGASDGAYLLSASFRPCAEGETCLGGACIEPASPEVEPNDDFATAQPLAADARIAGTIEAEGSADYFSIELTEGDTLRIDTSDACSMDTEVFVYGSPPPETLPDEDACSADDPAPALACDSDDGDGYCSFVEWPVPASGTYYIRVIDWLLDDAGDTYVLDVSVE